MSDHEDRWVEVGNAVQQRMAHLAVSQADVARTSGLSVMTIRPFMYGRPTNARPATMGRIAKALGWPPDAIQRILAGEDPATFDDHPPPPPGGNVTPLPRPTNPADDVVELAALVGQLPADKRHALEQLVRTMLTDDT